MNPAAVAGDEALARIAGGAMLYDAGIVGQPEPAIFDPAHWHARGAAQATPGGRGTVTFVRGAGGEAWVLRHYRRGGLTESGAIAHVPQGGSLLLRLGRA